MRLNEKKFRAGDRVRQNEQCPRATWQVREGHYREGRVRGFSADGRCVWVIWDDVKTPVSYHIDFIDKVEA